MKRSFDVIVSAIGLIFGLPLFLIAAGMILYCDGFPILFRQKRIGLHGRDFILYKFRTMSVSQDSSEGSFDVGNTDRVTRCGALLRKTKLDELPQLWNVLVGDMSLVGPRPEVREWVDVYPERWRKVLEVRPGITDPASIYYRNEEELLERADNPENCYREHILPHKLALYEDYIKTRTFWGDVGLIGKTMKSVILHGHCSPQADSIQKEDRY